MLKFSLSFSAVIVLLISMFVGWRMYETRLVRISEQEIKASFEESVPTGSTRRQLEQFHVSRDWHFKYYDIDEWHSYVPTKRRINLKSKGYEGFYSGSSNKLGEKGVLPSFAAYLGWIILIDKNDRVGLVEFRSVGVP